MKKYTFAKFLLPILAVLGCNFSSNAEAPSGYYATCEGRSGAQLLTSLHGVIGNHTALSYGDLWTLYASSDVDENGKIWDMYSTKRWTYKSDQCGDSYNSVGDCYNREHSFPKSWFDDASPMYTDAYHIYPTDGKVNAQRGNYPFGECEGGTYLSSSGGVKPLGRLGTSTFAGYSGKVFEPDDQYKGDFARTYFYMAACYNDRIAGWDSDMLAGNAYPAFSNWAVNLLLKWHREDPVSSKELTRNEAVADAQKNRNPFIDYPELAEHIWGDKSATAWYASGAVAPELVLPVNGSTVDLGTTVSGIARSVSLVVKGNNLKENVTLAVNGSAFSVSPNAVVASEASTPDGSAVTITFNPSQAGSFVETLTASCGELSSTINLTGKSITSIPAGPVSALSDCSFVATWSFVGDADARGEYTIDVRQDGVSLDSYPSSVAATDECYLVEDLNPATDYTYIIYSQHLSSDEIAVTTLKPQPLASIMYDGELSLVAEIGEASDIAELQLYSENIDSEMTISVDAPFCLSTDKSDWTQQIKLSPEEDRFYLRLLSDTAGSYRSAITISAGEYINDEAVVEGSVVAQLGFYEDFEVADPSADTYNKYTYQGTASLWNFSDAGIWTSDKANQGSQAVRMGKTASSCIEMAENYNHGLGIVTLFAATFNNDAAATFHVEYTTDGSNWISAGTATVETSNYAEFTFTLNVGVPARLRIRQTEGKRFMIDDIKASRYASVGMQIAGSDGWDAFCRDGMMIVQTEAPMQLKIYSLDGIILYDAELEGELVLPLPVGLYIATANSTARRVLVK